MCAPGEIGIGATQTCSIVCPTCGEACQGTFAAIFNNNCSDKLSLNGDSEDICKGGYNRDFSVSCSGENTVSSVYNGITVYGDCYRPNNSGFCGFSLGISTQYNNVYWCCKPVGGTKGKAAGAIAS